MARVEREDRRRRTTRTFRDAILLLALLAVLPTVRVSFPDRSGAHASDLPASPASVIAPAVARPPASPDPNCPASDDPAPAGRTAAMRVLASSEGSRSTGCVARQG